MPLLGPVLGELAELAPVVTFLAAVLLISELCERDGLFRAAGSLMARAGRGRPPRLLAVVFAIAALVTAVLGLDATVVLLTPVVFATAARSGVRPRPHVYACTHVANSGSLLLPVSNLTNLLALTSTGLGFGRFALLMALPWASAVTVEFLVLRRWFGTDLSVASPPIGPEPAEVPWPRFALGVLAVALGGFVAASGLGVGPAWVAVAAAATLAVRGLALRRIDLPTVVGTLNLPFLAFVLALGVAAAALTGPLSRLVGPLLPAGQSLPALLLWAVIAAVAANLVNNLPAAMVLIPLAAPSGAAGVLAVLIGVNLGPNLTYFGSVATLLWRRILRDHDHDASLGEFTRLGLASTPVSILAAVLSLWVALSIFGG